MSSFASMLMGEVSKAKDKAEKSIREELERVKAKAESYLTGMKVEPKKVKKEDSRERTRQLITDDVYLYSTKINDPLSFSFEIGSTCPKTLKIVLNFQGSENFRALDENFNDTHLELTMIVAPFHRKVLGSMVQVDPGVCVCVALLCLSMCVCVCVYEWLFAMRVYVCVCASVSLSVCKIVYTWLCVSQDAFIRRCQEMPPGTGVCPLLSY